MRNFRRSFKTILASVMAALVLLGPAGAWAENISDVSEYPDMGIYLVEMNTGTVLVSQNEHDRMYPGSLTKIMTAMVALDMLDPEQKVTVTQDELDLVGYNSSVADLEAGEELTVHQLLFAALIPSGNDAAIVLAAETGKLLAPEGASAEECLLAFIGRMNGKRAELGMSDTHFANPDGYDDWDNYSTAYDMFLMGRAAVRYPLIKEICSMNSVSVNTGTNYHTWYTTNMLHTETYTIWGETYDNPWCLPWVSGMKTGYTDMGRKCLLLSAEDDTLFVLGSILNVPSDTGTEIWERSGEILRDIFGKYSAVSVIDDDVRSASVRIRNRGIFEEKVLTVWAGEDPMLLIPSDITREDLEYVPVWEEDLLSIDEKGRAKLTRSIEAGERAAVLEIRSKADGTLFGSVEMIAVEDYDRAGILDRAALLIPPVLTAAVIYNVKKQLKKVRRKKRHAR